MSLIKQSASLLFRENESIRKENEELRELATWQEGLLERFSSTVEERQRIEARLK